jgi:hypothetical protein
MSVVALVLAPVLANYHKIGEAQAATPTAAEQSAAAEQGAATGKAVPKNDVPKDPK